ncbi:MAG: hypothetical protein LBT51_08425 [Fusobacteriaceae bacterium]|jgi:hypothetical protein|nr:hypothetical protein [Fusobacteriaceae bacterium]
MENKIFIKLDSDLYKKINFLGFYCHFISVATIIIRILGIIGSIIMLSRLSRFSGYYYYYFTLISAFLLTTFDIYIETIVFKTGTFFKKSIAENDGEILKMALLRNAFSVKLTIILIIVSTSIKIISLI